MCRSTIARLDPISCRERHTLEGKTVVPLSRETYDLSLKAGAPEEDFILCDNVPVVVLTEETKLLSRELGLNPDDPEEYDRELRARAEEFLREEAEFFQAISKMLTEEGVLVG